MQKYTTSYQAGVGGFLSKNPKTLLKNRKLDSCYTEELQSTRRNSLVLDLHRSVALDFPAMEFGRTSAECGRSVIACLLLFWCAGASCMLGKQVHGTATDARDPAAAYSNKTIVTVSAHAHACCKAKAAPTFGQARASERSSESMASSEGARLPGIPDHSGATACCPLMSGLFVAAARAHSNNAEALFAQDRPLRSLRMPLLGRLPVFPLRLPNQDQTYLRCCVFLI